MATIYKRTNSDFWYYDIPAPNGARRRVSTKRKNKREAQAVANAAELEIRAEAGKQPGAKPSVTVLGAVEAYIRALEGDGKPWAIEAASLRNRMFGLGKFAGRGALAAGLMLEDLSEDHLNTIRVKRRKEGLGPQSLGHELKVMRSAAILAGSLGHPAPTLRWRVPVAPSKTRYLSQDEWRRVYDELDPDRQIVMHGAGRHRDLSKPLKVTVAKIPEGLRAARLQARDLFVVLTLCGGRWGEVSRLTSDQVVPGGIILFGYKTGKERVVPCLPIMAEALDRRRAIAAAQGTPYLFPAGPRAKAKPKGAAEDAAPSEWQTQSSAIRRAFDRAGLNPPHLVERHGRATIHSLRHTFASWLLQGGRSLLEVQALLGHAGPAMTQRYAHLDKGHVATAAAATLGAAMEGVMGSAG